MSANGADLIVAQLSEQVARRVPEWFSAGAELEPAPYAVRRLNWSFSLSYPVRLPGGETTTLLAKIPRRPEMTQLAQAVASGPMGFLARQEYDSLRAIAAIFEQEETPEYAVVQPLACLDEWNAIIMHELVSQPLKKILLRPRMMLGRRQDWLPFETLLAQAGRWLRIFHRRVRGLQHEPLNLDHVRRDIQQVVDRLDQAALNQIDTQPLRTALLRAAGSICGRSVPLTTLHADFNCGNILVTPDRRLAVLDTDGCEYGPIYIDLAMLISDLVTRRIQVLTQGWFIRRHILAECEAAFLNGYFGALPPDLPVLDVYGALAVVRKWTMDEEMLSSASGGRRLAARALTAALRQYFWRLTWQFLTRHSAVDPKRAVPEEEQE